MRKQNRIQSCIPMLEIIITIGLFSIISLFLLKMFVSADYLQKKAERINEATLISQSLMEQFKGSDDWNEILNTNEYEEIHQKVNTVQECMVQYENTDGSIRIEMEQKSERLVEVKIISYHKGEEIYHLASTLLTNSVKQTGWNEEVLVQ